MTKRPAFVFAKEEPPGDAEDAPESLSRATPISNFPALPFEGLVDPFIGDAVLLMSDTTSSAVRDGLYAHNSAAAEATMGEDIEVPSVYCKLVPERPVVIIPSPGALISLHSL